MERVKRAHNHEREGLKPCCQVQREMGTQTNASTLTLTLCLILGRLLWVLW